MGKVSTKNLRKNFKKTDFIIFGTMVFAVACRDLTSWVFLIYLLNIINKKNKL